MARRGSPLVAFAFAVGMFPAVSFHGPSRGRKGRNVMLRKFSLLVSVLCLVGAVRLPAQDTAKGLLAAADKRVDAARGKLGDELSRQLKDAAALYEALPQRFPQARPEVARAELGLGRVRRRLGEFGAAEAAWKRAAESGESRPAAEALHDLATLYQKQKRVPEAEAALGRLVADFGAEPRERADALVRLGGLYRRTKRPADAETALRRVFAEHGDLLSPCLEALDDLVALKLAADKDAEAAEILGAQGAALKARFQGTKQESRLAATLDRIALRVKGAPDDAPAPKSDG
jgi:tetratricopeptide (TPR) repeat protein